MKSLWILLFSSLVFAICGARKLLAPEFCNPLSTELMNQVLSDTTANRARTILPSREGFIAGRMRPLTRHHIIPHNAFMRFATVAVQNRDLKEHVAEHFMSIIPLNRRASTDSPYPGHGRQDRSLYDRTILFLIEMFQWLPGNIFYGPGPQYRTNDPGHRFENDAVAIVGRDHFGFLIRLEQRMHNFTTMERHRTVNNYNQIMADFEELANGKPFEYNDRQWSLKNGKYSIIPPRHPRTTNWDDFKIENDILLQTNDLNAVESASCYINEVYQLLEKKGYFLDSAPKHKNNYHDELK